MDLMIPISGNQLRHTYFNPAIAYGSDNQGYADLGLGHRWIHNCTTLLGVYLFGGYTRSEHHAHLWVANPGLEAMGRRWDAHLNGYLSMGDRNYHYQDDYYDVYVPTGNQLRTIRQVTNDVFHSGNGLDLKFGYQLLSHVPLRGYIGGYYFHANEVNSIGGGALGLEYWLDDHIKSFAHYTYDNVHHSTGALGIGIELGGVRYHRSNPCIEERLTDPVERYLADLGHGSAIPGQTKHSLSGEPFVAQTVDNIAFFNQNGTNVLNSDNCTFENPCGPNALTTASATALNDEAALPGTKFYFNGGTYTNNAIMLLLEPGQSLHSRTADYTQPATGADRTTLSIPIGLKNNNTLENLIVNSNEQDNTAVAVIGIDNLIIGSDLNATDNATSSEKTTAILVESLVDSATALTVQNSIINAKNKSLTENSIGVDLLNEIGGLGSSINMINSQITAELSDANATGNVYGISTNTNAPVSNNNLINLTNTKITTFHNGTEDENSSIKLTFSSDIGTALNSQFTVNSTSGTVDSQIVIKDPGATMTITNGICTIDGSGLICP